MGKLLRAALMRPSQRTQMESTLVGLTFMMLGSILIAGYLIYTSDSNWFRFFLSLSEFGVLIFQAGLLSQTYQAYSAYKLENNMYPKDYKLSLKIDQAKELIVELNGLIEKEVKKC
jgi:uncharacterized membrane protein YesL